jgi:endonuclease/exonuclease/phosphatase family metal-dependent hydrolase
LLSRHPILEQETSTDPPFIRALIDPPDADPFTVIVVHPLPARFVTVARLPIALDTARRDAAIARIRSMIDVELAAGRSVVVLGDLNTTEREPAYADLTAGLRDAHLDAGIGPGFSWRPPQLRSLPFGLLRIDYILATPDFAAQASSVDCALPSDHCRLEATFVRASQD